MTVRALSATYGSIVALDRLDLTVGEGRVSVVLGRNGAGKTTMMETIAGVRPVRSGSVEVLGRPVSDRRYLSGRVGVMLQSGGVPTMARGVSFLRHLARLYDSPVDPDRLINDLDLVTRSVPFRRMSGGQQQRLRLACALIGSPRLALLDEPATGLDPEIRLRVWELIRGLAADGVTVLLSTHSFEEAEALADDLVVLVAGRVHTSGVLAELRGEPTIRFTARTPVALGDLRSAFPDLRAEQRGDGQYELSGPVAAGTVAAVARWADVQGLALDDLSLVRSSVRDMFERTAEDES